MPYDFFDCVILFPFREVLTLKISINIAECIIISTYYNGYNELYFFVIGKNND